MTPEQLAQAEIDGLRAHVRALQDRNVLLESALKNMLASAHPHPVEHPTMTAAWSAARALVEPKR